MPFELDDSVNVERDEEGRVRHLEHFQKPFVAVGVDASGAVADEKRATGFAPSTPRGLAAQYLREVAPIYGIGERMLPDQGSADSRAGDEASREDAPAGNLELAEEKELMGTTTVSYQQTYKGLPVWEAGVSVTIQPEPLRVTASQSSVHQDVSLPPADAFGGRDRYGEDAITPEVLVRLLGLEDPSAPSSVGADLSEFKINEVRRLVYRYDPRARIDPAARIDRRDDTPEDVALQDPLPTLPLPPLPDGIVADRHYEVTEVLFSLPVKNFRPLHWRAFVEVNTGAVLYLRALVACAAAMIFKTDPLTAGAPGNVLPTSPPAALNPFRSTVTLEGLLSGNPQPLAGQFVRLVDNNSPAVAPPTQPNPPGNFFFDATSREFAAANAYYHCDWLFRHMQGMGFDIATYFDGTTFPVPVDACAFDDKRNAQAPGNASGKGSGGFLFGLAGLSSPAVSMAAELRVVLHEFGHALLWDSVHWGLFGFAHSAGDSLAAIFMDPESALRDDPARRFETFPWVQGDRNHGRRVQDHWGWDGAFYKPFWVQDPGGYLAEQILSSTLFRLYRSMGGDAAGVARRRLASRQAIYLIIRAIGSLASSPVTQTDRPEVFATALMNADIGTRNFEGYKGGALHKVIRWSFEQQGLYQPPDSPRPVKTPGAPPPVDVFIDDGRNGEYQFQPAHRESKDIWNRLAPSAGGGGGTHQTPLVGQPNFAYVRVRNRGSQHADNVVVRGYSARAGAGLSWPGDWTPMDTPEVNVDGGVPPGGSVVVGPFSWTPRNVGNESMLMEVSADGDLSNIDRRTFFPCANGPTPDWQLVPFDNNLGQRNVAPVAGEGGLLGLLKSFLGRLFPVHKP